MTSTSSSDVVAAASPANTLSRIPTDMDKGSFILFKRNFLAYAGANGFMDELLELGDYPKKTREQNLVVQMLQILRQFTKGLYGNNEKLLIQHSSKIEMSLVPKPGSI